MRTAGSGRGSGLRCSRAWCRASVVAARPARHEPLTRIQHPLPPDTMTIARQRDRHLRRPVRASADHLVAQDVQRDHGERELVHRRHRVCMFMRPRRLRQRDAAGHAARSPSRGRSSADGKTWTWHLRRGAAFSDGHPITADDVLFSFAVAYDDTLHPSVQDLLIMLSGKKFEVSAPDSYTVVIQLPRGLRAHGRRGGLGAASCRSTCSSPPSAAARTPRPTTSARRPRAW